jgi:aryl-alcohol dehydrogenase-like predicted oxidoreductase
MTVRTADLRQHDRGRRFDVVAVRFKLPMLIPAKASFATCAHDGNTRVFRCPRRQVGQAPRQRDACQRVMRAGVLPPRIGSAAAGHERPMHQRRLGSMEVGAIGLGEMPLSIENRPDEGRAIATIHAALDAGVTLIDTADAYALGHDDFGHGEEIVARALREYGGDGSDVVVATKGGHTREPDGSWTLNGRPEYLREAARASLRRLGGDAIGLYQFHRPDPEVPFEESVGALRELRDEGIIRMAGISNASEEQIRAAVDIVGEGLVAVQNEFSPAFRSSEGELRLCGELGLAFLPWSPLGGISSAGDLGSRHAAFADVAAERGASAQEVCLAWMLAKGEHVLPIPGSSRPETIRSSASAADLRLSAEELARLDAA